MITEKPELIEIHLDIQRQQKLTNDIPLIYNARCAIWSYSIDSLAIL